MDKDPIAIIGIGCRFPGAINDTQSFWNLLTEGREAVSEVPADRWNVERFYDAEPGIAGKSIAKRGGFVHGIDQFDPQFFGISPREAPYVDPQQRLMLETAWEAIEDAGIVLDFEKGTDIAVYVGISHNDYQIIQGTPSDAAGISAHSPTGSAHSIAANRISYSLNLTGPSIAMDTACSSALTAVHAACEHIRSGRGTTALAGGVTVMINPGGFIGFSQAGMLSPEGRCKAFDASADGFVRGEGAGMVMLKRLSDALADGDPIHGVIRGTSVNQDGHTNGISLPCPEAQARLVRDACIDANIDPNAVGFVEAHGTGTAVGDPIEAHALAEALCTTRPVDQPLLIGSVKTNLGHLETAAGIAGLIKALLVVRHGLIPLNLHFRTPSTHIDFKALKLQVPLTMEKLPEPGGIRCVGVNSFGFGGANAHVILTDAPARSESVVPPEAGDRPWPLVLSARSEAALKGNATNLSAWLDDHMKSNGHAPLLPDLAYTLGARRNHHSYRLTLVAASPAEAITELQAFGAGEETTKIETRFAPPRESAPRIGFVMSGQGPQWWGMGRELLAREPVFRQVIEACDTAMRPFTRFSLVEELSRDEESSQILRTEIGQPAIFAMQMGLVALWKSWGIEPSAITGHSVGEVAAACTAGIFSLEEGSRIIALRARLMEDCARGSGTMLAVGLDERETLALLANADASVSIAAYNGPRSHTLAGPRSALEPLFAKLEADGSFARFVRVDHPFHSSFMQPAARSLETSLVDLKPQEEKIPFFSTVTGQRQSGRDCDATYWAQGIRQPVKFAPAVLAMADHGVDEWLEIGAHPALAISIQETLADRDEKPSVRSSIRREREHESLLETAMSLHRSRIDLDFAAIIPARTILTLPAYAWEKARWWSEASDWVNGRLAPGGRGLLDIRMPLSTPTWTARLDNRHMAFLKDHKVENHVIFPAAGFVDLILEAAVQYFEGRPFVIEDFEIRRPLILPEPASGVAIEVTIDPEARTFAILSRQGTAWSTHVVGSLRSERVESEFATSIRPASDDLPNIDVEAFYSHMHDLGLRYGEEFRGVRQLASGAGRSVGTVALTASSARRALEYPLHPVLLDGALHVFSSGAATLEGRKSRMKLPVRFARIQYLRSPGASCQVDTVVRNCNEELVEGDLAIYDANGAPCVSIEGFRGISLAAARKSGAPGGIRELIYHVDWDRTPTGHPVAAVAPAPLDTLREVFATALDEIMALRGRAKLEAAMVEEDELATAQIAAGLSAMGVHGEFTAETLGICDSMTPIFRRLIGALVERNLLAQKNDKWMPTDAFAAKALSAPQTLRTYLENQPGHLAEGLLCAAASSELGPILRGEKEAVSVLFGGSGAELLDQFYGDGLFSSPWMTAIAATVQAQAARLPEGRGLRILEVGGGTGGLAAHLLPLLDRGMHSYTFTDVSAAFFHGATQKLANFPEVEFKVFDLEKSAEEQDFAPESFDLVIGTNVLHAVSDVKAGLSHIHSLLVPGGTLLFMDTATPQLWTDSVFGLTSGWWRFTDHDLRTEHPLLQRAQWEKALREVGYAETASVSGLVGPHGGEGQVGLLARKGWKESVDEISPAPALPKDTSWVILADSSTLGDELAARVRATGGRCRIVRKADTFARIDANTFNVSGSNPADWDQLFAACLADAPPQRLLWLWSLDNSTEETPLLGTDCLLEFSQAVDRAMPSNKLQINCITRGAQAIGRRDLAVAQAPTVGLFRVILSEHPQFSCRMIDLDPENSDPGMLWQELLRDDNEREVAFRGAARYVQRIQRGFPSTEETLDPRIPLRLESRDRGILDSLAFTPFDPPQCGPDEVLIEVCAAGMNFRDVLKALGLYPAETIDARMFGDEVAGTITAVGSNVTDLAPGDRVFGIAVFGLATHSLARAGDVRKMPDSLSFEEAATIPVVFMTAWHSLANVARMRAGESILVHAGAGGVGMAAIQIALHLGVTVIASAGSPAKRDLLLTLGAHHVIDSRRGDFADAVMRLTNRRGVDVVLNALAGEAIPMGLSCLADFGRFIEIGKRDIYQNSRIPLWPLRNNVSFHVVAMDAVFNGDAALTRDLLAQVAELVEQGALRPLPFRAYPACRVDAAFRLMAQGKHIGKIIVTFAAPFLRRRGKPPVPEWKVRSDASYLITGAFGGFGKVLANWLVDSGARHLVLSSRSGASTPETRAFVKKLVDRGVEVDVVRADVGSPDDVNNLITEMKKSAHPPAGIFHLAMVIDDAPLNALSPERFASVMTPKAHGAWLLHQASLDLKLDAFVMFSSVSSIFGNPAQGNYAAANAFLDALAHHRRSQGLPALAINWGVLGGEGYVARNERVAQFLARQGTDALTPGEVVNLMESFLTSGEPQMAAIRVDWAKWRQSFRGLQENPLLEHILAATVEEGATGGNDNWRAKLDAAAPEEKSEVIGQAVRAIIGGVLRVKPESLRGDQPLTDLGLDSLMGAEIETSIDSALGVGLPPASLLRARTIGQIQTLIAEHMGAAPATPAPAEVPVSATTMVDEVDFDSLSDDDLGELMEEPAANPKS